VIISINIESVMLRWVGVKIVGVISHDGHSEDKRNNPFEFKEFEY
jgi:hypothetical protein